MGIIYELQNQTDVLEEHTSTTASSATFITSHVPTSCRFVITTTVTISRRRSGEHFGLIHIQPLVVLISTLPRSVATTLWSYISQNCGDLLSQKCGEREMFTNGPLIVNGPLSATMTSSCKPYTTPKFLS